MHIASWALLGALVASPVVAAEEWVDVIHSSAGTVWQVDKSAIQPARQGIQAWFRFSADHNLLPSSGADYRSGRTLRLFDCRGGRSAEIAYDWYIDPQWLGAAAFTEHGDPGNPKWSPPRPGSIEDALMSFICDFASRGDDKPSP